MHIIHGKAKKVERLSIMITQLKFHKITRVNDLKLTDNEKLLSLDKLTKGVCTKRGV